MRAKLGFQHAGELASALDTSRCWRCVRFPLWTYRRPAVSLSTGASITAKVSVSSILPKYFMAHIAQRRQPMASGSVSAGTASAMVS